MKELQKGEVWERMNRWGTYKQAAKEQEEVIRDRLFDTGIDEEKYEESLDYIYGLIKKDNSDEYLVDGAVLWCERATQEPVEVDGLKYYAGREGTSRLRVKHKSGIGDKSNVLTTDCKKDENIFSFGNCTLPLSEEDKEKLKRNDESRIKGTCHCLMNPDRVWDEYPRYGLSAYSYEDIRAITMNAGLFCKRGAWILPITSGQEKDYIDSVEGMTGEELEFAMRFGLSEGQLVIFEEIKEYFESYPELETGNTIFAFEGVGDYTGGKNKYHPDGQFGAIFVYCKDGELDFLTTEASTLPDQKDNAVVKDGVYNAIYMRHTGYQSLRLRDYKNIKNDNIPAFRYDGVGNTANTIDVHGADPNLSNGSNWSEGCMTVNSEKYYEFGVAAGFITPLPEGEEPPHTNKEFKEKIKSKYYGEDEIIPWGCMVVDRQFMTKEDRKFFFDEDNGQENN